MDDKKNKVIELENKIKFLEKKLDLSNSMLEKFVNASYDGYWDWHIQDDYEYMSPRFWEIFGIDYKTKKHHPSEWQDIIFQEDLKIALNNFDKHIKTKGKHPYRQEVRYFHKNGSVVTVLCRGHIIEYDEKGSPKRMIGTHTDITELKRLRSRSKELGRFAYVASHELESPINAINNISKWLQEDHSKKLDKKVLELVKTLVSKVNHLSDLNEALVEYSKYDLLDLDYNQVMLDEVLNYLKSKYQSKRNISLKFPKNKLKISVIKGLLLEVLEALVENSVLHNDSKNKDISISINTESDTHIILKIKDNGLGIDSEIIEKIYEPFKSYGKYSDDCTGMGLTTIKMILGLYGCDIWHESKEKDGTSCFFSWPKVTFR